MKTKYLISTAIIFLITLWGCSELQKELPEPTSPLLIHNQSWNKKDSENFHGKYLKTKNYKLDECIQCHAGNFEDGISKVACYTCHDSYPHKAGWKATTQITFHGKYIKEKQWDMKLCTGCHGNEYDGGSITNVSCMTSQCHVDESQNKKSPEACNTCHGVFKAAAGNIKTWAPPKSVLGDTLSTIRGVGAHQQHLVAGKLGKHLKCAECHSVPNQAFVTGHFDTNLPSEVVMKDTLARTITGGGTIIPNPVYNYNEGTCSNTYCHGFFKNGNNNFKPNWTDVSGNQIKCGTCHGNVNKPTLAERALPGGTHIQILTIPCSYCHYEVVDENMNIINKDKHINGIVDLKSPPKR